MNLIYFALILALAACTAQAIPLSHSFRTANVYNYRSSLIPHQVVPPVSSMHASHAMTHGYPFHSTHTHTIPYDFPPYTTQPRSYIPSAQTSQSLLHVPFTPSIHATWNTYSYFVVVTDKNLIGRYFNLEHAKARLMEFPIIASKPARMIAEVVDGVVTRDPHTVGGENQGGGINAGFNKWWWGWHSNGVMAGVAQKFVNNQPVSFVVVAQSSVVGLYSNIEDAKKKLFDYPVGSWSPSRMIVEVFGKEVQPDPHTVGGQNQGGGMNTGFNKWWWDWNDIHRMASIAQTFMDGKHSMFAVVANQAVVGYYSSVEDAKEKLTEYSSGTSSPSRMVSEVIDGVVQKDPHTVGGQNQGDGVKAGFNKWWRDWNDINKMTSVVEKFIA